MEGVIYIGKIAPKKKKKLESNRPNTLAQRELHSKGPEKLNVVSKRMWGPARGEVVGRPKNRGEHEQPQETLFS